MNDDALMREVASNAGDYAVSRYGRNMSKERQLRLWKRHYDGALAACMAYAEVSAAIRVRNRALSMEN